MPTKISWLGHAVCAAVVCVSVVSVATADTVSSTFDTDANEWTALNLYADGTLGNPASVAWTASSGNPAGYISRSDYGSATYGFSAPAEFLGNKSSYIGGALSWDMKNSVADYLPYSPANHLLLVGGGLTITHWGQYPVTSNTWTHVVVPLAANGDWTLVVDESNWRAPLTDEQFASVFANLEAVWLKADWGWGMADTSGLDNVIMQVPEPATLGVLALGGLAILRRRKA